MEENIRGVLLTEKEYQAKVSDAMHDFMVISKDKDAEFNSTMILAFILFSSILCNRIFAQEEEEVPNDNRP